MTGYVTTAPDGTIRRANRDFVALTGRSGAELIDKLRFQELLTPGCRIFHETHYVPLLLLQGQVREIAIDLRRPDGTAVPALVNAVLRRDAGGAPESIRTVVFPATQRRSYERELLRARDEERSARERTERLQRLTARLAGEVDPERIADAVVAGLVADGGADEVALALHDERAGELRVVRRHGGDSLDVLAAPPEPLFAIRGGRGSALLPLMVAGGATGVLGLGFPGVHGFDADDRALLTACASQCAQALERGRLFAAVAELAGTDELTGLPNRRAWQEHLARELARARRGGQPVCLAVLDLDHFKRYNDTHGHPAGDRLLRRVAAAWSGALRPEDLLARYGGEEFVALISDLALDDAATLMERLRGTLPSGITCSAGVAEWDRLESGEALLARADAALYRAKQDGRDRVALAGPLSARWS